MTPMGIRGTPTAAKLPRPIAAFQWAGYVVLRETSKTLPDHGAAGRDFRPGHPALPNPQAPFVPGPLGGFSSGVLVLRRLVTPRQPSAAVAFPVGGDAAEDESSRRRLVAPREEAGRRAREETREARRGRTTPMGVSRPAVCGRGPTNLRLILPATDGRPRRTRPAAVTNRLPSLSIARISGTGNSRLPHRNY